jgi:hypothetical protein
MIASIMLQLCASMGRKMFGNLWGRTPCLGNVWIGTNTPQTFGRTLGAYSLVPATKTRHNPSGRGIGCELGTVGPPLCRKLALPLREIRLVLTAGHAWTAQRRGGDSLARCLQYDLFFHAQVVRPTDTRRSGRLHRSPRQIVDWEGVARRPGVGGVLYADAPSKSPRSNPGANTVWMYSRWRSCRWRARLENGLPLGLAR